MGGSSQPRRLSCHPGVAGVRRIVCDSALSYFSLRYSVYTYSEKGLQKVNNMNCVCIFTTSLFLTGLKGVEVEGERGIRGRCSKNCCVFF